jgi:hypothetical protein
MGRVPLRPVSDAGRNHSLIFNPGIRYRKLWTAKWNDYIVYD